MAELLTETACDVVVIGSGVIGSACAYNLAKKGRKVTVLEREANVGEGASSRNGSGVRQSGRDARELPLAMYAVEHLWPQLSDELGADVEYVKKGNLRLGKTEEHLKTLTRLATMSQGLGLDMKMISAEEVREINPYLSDQVIGASWCPTDGHANPMRTTLAYYRAAKALGVRYITGCEVTALKKARGRIAKVETSAGTFSANDVVVAAGLGSRRLTASVGIDIPMHGELIECLVTEAMPEMFPQMLGVATGDFYGCQTNHGSFVFGGGSGLEPYNGTFGGRPTYSITAPAECRAIMGYIPRLADAKIVRTWAGWEDESADGVPVISKIDEVPGLTVACAFTGHGFGISPIVGLLLAEMVCDEETTLDVSAFRYDRFKAEL